MRSLLPLLLVLGGCAEALPLALPNMDPTLASDLVREIRAGATSLVGDDAQALAPFGQAVGDATIVGLGETSHGIHEMIDTKARLFKYLVATKGFTVFTLEAPWSGGWPIERYLQTGEGDALDLVRHIGFWCWNNQAMVDLVGWMRQYNADPAHARKLHFVSIDNQAPNQVAEDVQAYARAHMPDQAAEIERRYAYLRAHTASDYAAQDAAAQAACRRDLAAVVQLLEGAVQRAGGTPDAELLRARQAAQVVQQGEEFWASMALAKDGGTRDVGMAANVDWVANVAFPGQRLVFSAANAHVGTSPLVWTGSTGSYLRAEHGRGYFVLGFSFHHGAIYGPGPEPLLPSGRLPPLPVPPALPGSLDALFHEAGQTFSFLDLRRLDPGSVLGAYLAGPIYARNGGAGYGTEREVTNYQKFAPRDAFDALVYIDEVTPATPP